MPNKLLRPGSDPGIEYFLDFGNDTRCGHGTSGPFHWHALHESSPGNGVDRGHSRRCKRARKRFARPCRCASVLKRSRWRSTTHRVSYPIACCMPMINEAAFRCHGRRCHRRSCRRDHETGNESPDGPCSNSPISLDWTTRACTFSTSSTRVSATQSIAPARFCGKWLPPAGSDARVGKGFTITREKFSRSISPEC